MGIYRDKRSGSWVARGKTVNGKREYLGTFKTDDEARNAFAVNEMARQRAEKLIPLTELPLHYEPRSLNPFKALLKLFKRA